MSTKSWLDFIPRALARGFPARLMVKGTFPHQHPTSFVVLMRVFLSFGGIKLQCGFMDSPPVGWRS